MQIVSDGTWTGTAPITFTYNWQSQEEMGSWVNFTPVLINSSIVLPLLGRNIRCIVTGTNIGGSVQSSSNVILAPMIWGYESFVNWGSQTTENWL
jgi:hypothetical protein